MNKKLIIALSCVVLVFCFVLSACDVSAEQLVLDQLSAQIQNANEANVSITIRENTEVVSTETIKYDFTTGKKTTTKKVPNTDFSADSAWSETTTTTDITPAGVAFDWQQSSFTTLALDNLTLVGTLSGDAIPTNLGISADKVDGDVTIAITITGDISSQAIQIVRLNITYKSNTGNDVSIIVTLK